MQTQRGAVVVVAVLALLSASALARPQIGRQLAWGSGPTGQPAEQSIGTAADNRRFLEMAACSMWSAGQSAGPGHGQVGAVVRGPLAQSSIAFYKVRSSTNILQQSTQRELPEFDLFIRILPFRMLWCLKAHVAALEQ